MVKILFWLSASVLFWTYIGYPLALMALKRLGIRRSGVRSKRTGGPPSVSIVIAAHNEEHTIGARIQNCLSLDYPEAKLEIIVASDGSMDRTVEIAKGFRGEEVGVLAFDEKRGRAAVHNDAVRRARGDIVVFTDAATRFEKNFLRELVRHFSDPRVGAVVGKLIFRPGPTATAEAEGTYWRYESRIRQLESDLGILAFGTGACMGVRKELFSPLHPTHDIDFCSTLEVLTRGHRIVYEPHAIAYDDPPTSVKAQLKCRARQSSQSFVGTLRKWGFANVFRHPRLSWGFFSHRVLRWLTPYFMVVLFVSNVLLLGHGWLYGVALAGQAAFYLFAIVGGVAHAKNLKLPVAPMVFSFCVANIGLMVGVARGLLGRAPASYRSATDRAPGCAHCVNTRESWSKEER